MTMRWSKSSDIFHLFYDDDDGWLVDGCLVSLKGAWQAQGGYWQLYEMRLYHSCGEYGGIEAVN